MQGLVIIPTYNEVENIGKLIREILTSNEDLDILVVDDNSLDGTARVVERLANEDNRVKIINRKGKRGYGLSCIEGMSYGIKKDYNFIFTMDADFSHQPVYLKDFKNMNSKYDLIIGSRYTDGIGIVNWSLTRLFLSLCANIYMRFVTRVKISDFTSGFRCYKRSILEKIDLEKVSSDGYAFLVELLFKAYHADAEIAEIPIIFIERKHGKSKLNFRILLESAIIPLKLVLKKLFGRL